jgi:hypothetical protein
MTFFLALIIFSGGITKQLGICERLGPRLSGLGPLLAGVEVLQGLHMAVRVPGAAALAVPRLTAAVPRAGGLRWGGRGRLRLHSGPSKPPPLLLVPPGS